MMALKQPSHAEVDRWFSELIKHRTVRAGLAPNRIVAGPRAIIQGNQADPNGVCGDCVLYVAEQYAWRFGNMTTTNGRNLWRVVWDGLVLGHTANIMAPAGLREPLCLRWRDGKVRVTYPIDTAKRPVVRDEDLKSWIVYDLYYKRKCSLREWWDEQDGMGGKVALADIQDDDIFKALKH
jgi:hypothetical protein